LNEGARRGSARIALFTLRATMVDARDGDVCAEPSTRFTMTKYALVFTLLVAACRREAPAPESTTEPTAPTAAPAPTPEAAPAVAPTAPTPAPEAVTGDAQVAAPTVAPAVAPAAPAATADGGVAAH
jgi:hypothetical protein